jgi:hypothetical protein
MEIQLLVPLKSIFCVTKSNNCMWEQNKKKEAIFFKKWQKTGRVQIRCRPFSFRAEIYRGPQRSDESAPGPIYRFAIAARAVLLCKISESAGDAAGARHSELCSRKSNLPGAPCARRVESGTSTSEIPLFYEAPKSTPHPVSRCTVRLPVWWEKERACVCYPSLHATTTLSISYSLSLYSSPHSRTCGRRCVMPKTALAIRLVAWGESIRERRESFCLRHDARVGLNYSKMRLLLAFPLLLFRLD